MCQSEKAKGGKEIHWKRRDEYLMIIPNRQMFVPKQIRTNSFSLSMTALFRHWPSHTVYMPFFSLTVCHLMSYLPLNYIVYLIKLHLFSLTQHRIIFIQIVPLHACYMFGLYLYHHKTLLFSRLYNVSTSSCARLAIIVSSSSSCFCHSSRLPSIPFPPSVL